MVAGIESIRSQLDEQRYTGTMIAVIGRPVANRMVYRNGA